LLKPQLQAHALASDKKRMLVLVKVRVKDAMQAVIRTLPGTGLAAVLTIAWHR
jgi:hypothetical protein